jgi:hypothetical protein
MMSIINQPRTRKTRMAINSMNSTIASVRQNFQIQCPALKNPLQPREDAAFTAQNISLFSLFYL